MPRKIEAYECEHCKKHITRTKGGMKQHEKKCFWNSKTMSCMTCENYISCGHNVPHCYHKKMNELDLYGNNEYKQSIIKLQTKCELYIYDELTLEERKQLKNEMDSDAQADWDEYYGSIGV